MDKDFCRCVGIVLRAAPEGKVVTYGQAALLCGRPRKARQVGCALRNGCGGVAGAVCWRLQSVPD